MAHVALRVCLLRCLIKHLTCTACLRLRVLRLQMAAHLCSIRVVVDRYVLAIELIGGVVLDPFAA